MLFRKPLIVIGLLSPSVLGACAFMRNVGNFFSPTQAQLERPAPAEQDLPSIQTVAMAPLQGKEADTQAIAGALGEKLMSSQRFKVVEREQLTTIAKENSCAGGDYGCVAKSLPASAVILGSISESSYHETVDSQHYECGDGTKKKQCTTNTRKGTAKVTANLRLVETATGRVLAQRLSTKTASTDTTGNDDAAPAIDSGSLIDQARAEVAQDFFEMISPHRKTETLRLQFDSDLPLLDRGNDQMQRREFAPAVETYRTAVKQADDSKTLDAKVKAKAHYDLAVGLMAIEDFAGGASELAKANQLSPDDDWQVLAQRVTTWQSDAELVKKQLAYATPVENDAATSDEAAKSASVVQ